MKKPGQSVSFFAPWRSHAIEFFSRDKTWHRIKLNSRRIVAVIITVDIVVVVVIIIVTRGQFWSIKRLLGGILQFVAGLSKKVEAKIAEKLKKFLGKSDRARDKRENDFKLTTTATMTTTTMTSMMSTALRMTATTTTTTTTSMTRMPISSSRLMAF